MTGVAGARRPGDGWAAPEDAAALRRLVGATRRTAPAGRNAPAGRSALMLHVAALPPAWPRPHQLRLAQDAMAPLLRASQARCFRLANETLVAVWRGESGGAEQGCRAELGHLFAGAGPVPARTLERFDLPADADRLLAAIAEAERAPLPRPVDGPARPPLDPRRLAALESRLAAADVARFLRRRDICAPGPQSRFVVRWQKCFLSVAEIAAELTPDHDPQGDPWLFRRLTRTLDQRMLALLAASGGLDGAGPFAINLNVSSILSPGFLRFDSALPVPLRGQVAFDVSLADALADPAVFRFARDFARARGYRLLLRGISGAWADAVSPAGFGVDYLQIRWHPALAKRDRLPFDPACAVLGRCETQAAVACGRRLGIMLFQGAAVARGGAPHDADDANEDDEDDADEDEDEDEDDAVPG